MIKLSNIKKTNSQLNIVKSIRKNLLNLEPNLVSSKDKKCLSCRKNPSCYNVVQVFKENLYGVKKGSYSPSNKEEEEKEEENLPAAAQNSVCFKLGT